MAKSRTNPDKNIIKALKELKLPLLNYEGTKIYFQKRKRYETVYEHIADKSHHLKLKDIEIIRKTLLDKRSVRKDNKTPKAVNYYGRRKGIEKQKPWLRIICVITKDGTQEISNIYPHKKDR